MKKLFIFCLTIALCSFYQTISSTEISKKEQIIWNKLIAGKFNPSLVHQIDSLSNKNDTSQHNYSFKTIRNEDSLYIYVTVFSTDSLKHLDFVEDYLTFENKNHPKSLGYSVNKYGIIDWGYYMPDSTGKPVVINRNGHKDIYTPGKPIIEINLYPRLHDVLIQPDDKTLSKYNARLIQSLTELEKMLR